jgi:hypothetical protein
MAPIREPILRHSDDEDGVDGFGYKDGSRGRNPSSGTTSSRQTEVSILNDSSADTVQTEAVPKTVPEVAITPAVDDEVTLQGTPVQSPMPAHRSLPHLALYATPRGTPKGTPQRTRRQFFKPPLPDSLKVPGGSLCDLHGHKAPKPKQIGLLQSIGKTFGSEVSLYSAPTPSASRTSLAARDDADEDEVDEAVEAHEGQEEVFLTKAPALDGGWGWMCVLGCALMHILIGGLLRSYGVIYVKLRNKFNSSATITSWVGGGLTALMMILGELCSV